MHPLTTQIVTLRRRLVWRERLAALCRTLAVVLAAACALGLADYLVRFTDRGLRVMITATLALAAAWAIYRWWISPRRGRIGPLAVARRIESRFPQLRDRLASAVEFLEQSETDPTAGSAMLRRAVVADAELAISDLPLETVIDRRSLRQAATWAAVAVVLVLLGLAVDAAAVRTALVRLIAPLGTTEWPRENHLEFRDAPTRLAAGQTFEVELVDRRGRLPDDVRIEYRFEQDGRREIQSDGMMRVGDVMVARRDDVRQSFAYRAEGGDDRTMRWIGVEVVEPPQLSSLATTLHPPTYTGLAATPAERHLEVLVGTGIEIVGAAAEPLGAARVIVGDVTVEAQIRADAAGDERHGFFVAPDRFVAETSGSYRIELANLDGVTGTVGRWNLRVEPDTPPSVTWRQPPEDLYVLPTAVVPLAVVVKDNLAIAQATLHSARSDRPEEEELQVELYRGPERAPARDLRSASRDGEVRQVEYAWPLAPLELPVGTQLTLHVAAADYRPGTGRTATPRHVTIISPEELDARLADRQAQIARRLDEALTLEEKTHNDVRRLVIQLRDAGQLTPRDQDALQAAELSQRRVGRTLSDSADGVPALADALLAELDINGIDSGSLRDGIDLLQQTLNELAVGPLAAADEQLTSARKFAEAGADASTAHLTPALSAAGTAQEEVISALAQLVKEFGGAADYGRLVRDLAQLRKDQLAHRQSARNEISLETLPLELRELSPAQRAALNKAAAAQDALARRFNRISQAMTSLAAELTDGDAAVSARLADAANLAAELAIDRNMQQASRELGENRVGTALARQQQIADALQKVIDTLQDRRESDPDRLAEQLRAAERELTALRQQLAELRRDVDETEQRSETADDRSSLQQLHDRQQRLHEQISRLARELDRLQAEEASRSTDQAARQLADDRADSEPPRPADSERVEQAERHLAEAASQLAQRRRQAEEEVALMMLRQFQTALAAMVADQRAVVDATAELDAQRAGREQLTDLQQRSVAELADTERRLADEAHVQSEMLTGLRVFEAALGEAATQLSAAADLLGERITGKITQQAERRALERLDQIVWALEQTAAEAGEQPPSGAGADDGAGGAQSPRPTFDLFEVKLLRMLQADLNQRTQAFEQRVASEASADDERGAAQREQAEQLAAEQGRLAELVEELASRNNEQDDDEQ